MNLKNLRKHWDRFGKSDPLWAICTWEEKKGNKWNLNEFFAYGRREINGIMRDIDALSVHLSYKKALDFGCGAGRLTQALAKYFDEVHGVDIAPSMIELAKRYNCYGAKCKYHLNIANNLKLFPDNSFDFIYTSQVLQHMEPRYSKGYIREFLRILKSNGLLVFHIVSNVKLKQRHTLKQQIKRMLPTALLDLYYSIRYGEKARMEMYGIKKEDVIKFLNENEAKIVDIKEDNTSPEKFPSFIYYVRRNDYKYE